MSAAVRSCDEVRVKVIVVARAGVGVRVGLRLRSRLVRQKITEEQVD